ncbi:hypothetical protein ES319_D03G187200v1, partial [Gossypium barbadense]
QWCWTSILACCPISHSSLVFHLLGFTHSGFITTTFGKRNGLHQPGIEPGSVPWQGTILPLDHWCLFVSNTCILFI